MLTPHHLSIMVHALDRRWQLGSIGCRFCGLGSIAAQLDDPLQSVTIARCQSVDHEYFCQICVCFL